jgi:hypothetical protein
LFDNAFQYTVSPAILAVFSTLGILGSFGGSKNSKKSTKNSNSNNTNRTNVRRSASTIYVCKPLSTDIYYEIKDNKVYKHLTSKVIYEIKGDKVYRQFEPKPILIIKGNKLYFPNKTAQQLSGRWEKVLNPKLVKGSWTAEEDEIILRYVTTNGVKDWAKLASLLHGRTGNENILQQLKLDYVASKLIKEKIIQKCLRIFFRSFQKPYLPNCIPQYQYSDTERPADLRILHFVS